MGFIRMSPSFVTTLTTKFMMFNQIATTQVSYGNATSSRGFLISHGNPPGAVGARLAIMQGTIPVDFSTLTSYNARISDTLAIFDASPQTSSTAINQFTGSTDNTNPMVITTTYVNAIASGTATWFWWFVSTVANTTHWDNSDLPSNQIIGTVGITGSGADLTLPSVSLSLGSPYRIYDYRLQIPTEWTF
jgi:hypothetical protein